MPRAQRWTCCVVSSRQRIGTWLLSGGSIAICFAASTLCLIDFLSRDLAGPLWIPSAAALAICGLVQAIWARALTNQAELARHYALLHSATYWQLICGGALACYLIALLIGPLAGIGWAWLAAVAVWQTALLLPLSASHEVAENWRQWIESHRPRRLTWLVAAAFVTLVAGELALRAQRAFDSRAYAASIDSVAISRHGSSPTEFGPFTLRLDRLSAARLRVALIGETGGTETLKGLAYSVQQALPAAEIISLATQWDDPRVTASELAAALEQIRPDVVLAVLPACDEVVPPSDRRNLFDWRQFELAQLLSDKPSSAVMSNAARPAEETYETFLAELGPHLAACRTPLNAGAKSRWQRTFAALDRTQAGCAQAQVAMAVIMVPAELQLNAGLRQTLLRRNGLSNEQFDVDLPQRQLAGFAQQRALAVVDLLPSLRLCSQPVYARNTTRLSETGNHLAGAAIGGWLQSRYSDRLAAQLSRAK